MNRQAQVNDYAKLSARIKKLKDQHEELRQELIPYLLKHECPDKGPFYLELNEIPRTLFSWEKLGRDLLADKYGKGGVNKMVKRLKKLAGTQNVPTITIKVNESWKD